MECARGAQSTFPECQNIGDVCLAKEPYSCLCDEDAFTGPKWSGPNCDQDVDECAALYWDGFMETGACPSWDFICTNTPGSYECSCPEGTTQDGSWCPDIDECSEMDAPCGPNAICTNKYAGFDCSCEAGHIPDPDLPEGAFGCVPESG